MINRTRLSHLVFMGTCTLVGLLCTFLGLSDEIMPLFSVLWTVVFAADTVMILQIHVKRVRLRNMVLLALIVRWAMLMAEVITNGGISDILNILDGGIFERIALNYYQGIRNEYSTNYPNFVNLLFRVFGGNAYVVRMFNIWLSIYSTALATRIVTEVCENRRHQFYLTALLCFAPYNIVYSIMLMREPVFLFSVVLSLHMFRRWRTEKKNPLLYAAVIASLPAVYFHSGYFVFPAYYAYRFLAEKRTLTVARFVSVVVGAAAFVGVYYYVTSLSSMHYLTRNSGNGLLSSISTTLRQHNNQGGGSQYLSWMRVENIFQLILYTPLRLFFFMTSPFPTDWRGISDIASFSLDGLFYLYVTFRGIAAWVNRKLLKKQDHYSTEEYRILLSCLAMALLTGIVFCWGTSTSGAAIRHRNCLFPLETIMLGIMLNADSRRRAAKRGVQHAGKEDA